MSLIQRSDIGLRLIKALEVKERGPSPTLGSVVTPVVIVEDITNADPHHPANAFRDCCGSTSVIPVGPANYPFVQLWNPLSGGSTIIEVLRVTVILDQAVGGQDICMGFSTGPVATLLTNTGFLDRRVQGSPTAELRWGEGPIPPAGTLSQYFRAVNVAGSSEGSLVLPTPGVVLPEGTGFVIGNSQLAQNLACSITWREWFRSAE